MESYNTPPDRDPQLWELAKRRASFKSHLATYFAVNTFLWILWYFTNRHNTHDGIPWPIWPTIGWGIGLAMHYIGAYILPNSGSVEKEYEKLKRQKENN